MLKCCSTNIKQLELSGLGELMTLTIIRVAPEGFKTPYIVGLIRTKEGPWIIGRLDKDLDLIDESNLGRLVQVTGFFSFTDNYSGGERVCPKFSFVDS